MKRTISIILSIILLTAAISGCAQTSAQTGDKRRIVCTIFPPYDWTRQILGGNANEINLTMLLDSGVDLHSFQPSVDDIVKISTCDLFIYVGGESDQWVENALREATNPDMMVINLLDTLGSDAKIEDIIEGMENDGPHEHEAHNEEEHTEDGHSQDEPTENEHANEYEESARESKTVYDEHVWLSLKNAEAFCTAIADALSALDAGNAEEYAGNMTAYTDRLRALDAQYRQAAEAAPIKTLLFGDRFPFRYLADDYGLNYHAAFPGCSAETEASFDTIMFLANKTDELNLNAVMVTESADKSIAETIINNTGEKDQQIQVLNSLQSVTPDDIRNGATYLSIMEENLTALTKALQ